MASPKEYGYFIKGSKLSIIEKDTALDNDINSRDYGPDVHRTKFVSPRSSVTDGIELEYIYSPKYHINDVSDTQAITGYEEDSNGFLKVTGSGMSTDTAVDYIVIRGSDKLNGLHKVTTRHSSYWILTTKYNGDAVTESITAYQDIDVLNNESDELPLSEYLSKAVVYFVKAKMAEDIGQFDLKNAMMREFYRIVEKNDNAKIHTIRRVAPHSAAIR
tara:strand:- start:1748 stop:2398 length:651 start_codon:yes stop_codon:yes gene_type:complete